MERESRAGTRLSTIYWHSAMLLLLFTDHTYPWPISYNYIMADFTICQRTKPDVVIWVQGRASTPTHRTIIREIIASHKLWPDSVSVMTLFFVGQSPHDPSIQNLLEYEYEQFGDIIQNDYIENYKNQTAKMMSAINFLSDYCPKIKLAIRIDDDVVFIPSIMIRQLIDNLVELHISRRYKSAAERSKQLDIVRRTSLSKKLGQLPINTVACKYLKKLRIGRQSDNVRYPVNDNILPGRILYPDYCAGFFIAITSDLLRIFQIMFKSQRPFWIDDAYLGVLQEQLRTYNFDLGDLLLFSDPSNGKIQSFLQNYTVYSAPVAIHLEQPHFSEQIGEAGFLNFNQLSYQPVFLEDIT